MACRLGDFSPWSFAHTALVPWVRFSVSWQRHVAKEDADFTEARMQRELK